VKIILAVVTKTGDARTLTELSIVLCVGANCLATRQAQCAENVMGAGSVNGSVMINMAPVGTLIAA